jgi:hypothetical protein
MTNIHKEIEALSDAELDGVAGGSPLGDAINHSIQMYGVPTVAHGIGGAIANMQAKLQITHMFMVWHPFR